MAANALHGNALSGAIPAPAGPNGTCDRLRLLDLGANRFSGGFPAFLTAFRGLQRLDLGGNRLSGPVPDSLAAMRGLQMLNLSYNNFSGPLPPAFSASAFTEESFLGNGPALCGQPLRQPCVSPSGLSSGGVAGVVIGLMAGIVVAASVCIGWAQGRWRRNRVRRAAEEGAEETEEGEGGDGKLVVFQGGEHLTLEEVLNATGQVVEKASYCTVYKAKLADGGGSIELRLLREGSCRDAASCGPAVRRIGRARHENLVPLRRTKLSNPCVRMQNLYCCAKMMAEITATEEAAKRGLELAVVVPSMTMGPMLEQALNFSSSHVARYLTGAKPTYPNAVAAYTDVRDVVRAHVLAYERPDARGRYLCIGAVLHRPRGVHPAHEGVEDGSDDAETCAR